MSLTACRMGWVKVVNTNDFKVHILLWWHGAPGARRQAGDNWVEAKKDKHVDCPPAWTGVLQAFREGEKDYFYWQNTHGDAVVKV
jgi:hypothetical protein